MTPEINIELMTKTSKETKLMIVFHDMALGGIQRKIIDIALFLKRFHPKVKIILCLIEKEGIFADQLPDNVTITTPKFKTRRHYLFWYILWMVIQIWRHNPTHILSFMDIGSIPTLAALRLLFWKKPKVTIGEDILTSKYVVDVESSPKLRFWLIKLFYPKANTILVQTPVQKQDLINIIGMRINKQVIVSPNWLPLPFPPKKRSNQTRSTDILYLGRIEAQKNLFRFVKIIQRLRGEFPNLSVKIVGSGSQTQKIAELINKLNLNDTIKILSATNDPAKYYLDSRIFLLTSDYEGFPLTLMEAISCDCYPVIRSIDEINRFFDRDKDRIVFNSIPQAIGILRSLLNHPETSPSLSYYQKKVVYNQSTLISQYVNRLIC